MSQLSLLDKLCLECPLATCDANSLWCIRSFATDPNAAQKRVMLKTRLLSKSKRSSRLRAISLQKEREYGAEYREVHREAKRQYDRERYAGKGI